MTKIYNIPIQYQKKMRPKKLTNFHEVLSPDIPTTPTTPPPNAPHDRPKKLNYDALSSNTNIIRASSAPPVLLSYTTPIYYMNCDKFKITLCIILLMVFQILIITILQI